MNASSESGLWATRIVLVIGSLEMTERMEKTETAEENFYLSALSVLSAFSLNSSRTGLWSRYSTRLD